MKKLLLITTLLVLACTGKPPVVLYKIQDVNGLHQANENHIWLTHEHILVDFIGADKIDLASYNHDTILHKVLPYLNELKKLNVSYFVDPTPMYIGRDVKLLKKIADCTGMKILTNTGLYGARNNQHIPQYAYELSAQQLANMWINEYKQGIEGTDIKPGFIKIAVAPTNTLSALHQKLVRAAALTHLQTGLTIVSHTGPAAAVWPQLKIIEEMGVSPEAFIWVHAQWESDNSNYIKAAKMGCWVSLDGLGWDIEQHRQKLLFAKENGILHKILISHDSGWFDPQNPDHEFLPFTDIFLKLYPLLIPHGFTDEEFGQLLTKNPPRAFGLNIRKLE